MLVGGQVLESLVRSLGIVLSFRCAQGQLEGGEVEIAVIALPEIASHRAIEALNAAMGVGAARRQNIKGNALLVTRAFEIRHELCAAIDLDRLDRHRHTGTELVEEGGGRGGGAPRANHRATRDDIDRRQFTAFDAGQGTVRPPSA